MAGVIQEILEAEMGYSKASKEQGLQSATNYFVEKGKRGSPEWVVFRSSCWKKEEGKTAFDDDAPPGSFAVYHESGWITKETFLACFRRLVLLLLDGHSSHAKRLGLTNLARENNVVLLCFPPDTTHRMQPLDVSFMAPLSV
ncbi:hypothetical protein PR048_013374 [Dryococelus australis]|uniref:DDE-1 domain-containing protein n=1 Tax=Dryococelus australis TaxID=614101 RepID=A0ABQ9HRZ9_9NEOP|nr:hypothetical protein PR048_013374 [Dryococelus australis]